MNLLCLLVTLLDAACKYRLAWWCRYTLLFCYPLYDLSFLHPYLLQVTQRDVPGIDVAYLAMDMEEGREVVWNEVQFSARRDFKAQEVFKYFPFFQGKKYFYKFWGLLFKLACMKITLFNLFCIELYSNFGGSFWHFGGKFALSRRVFFSLFFFVMYM